MNKAFHLNSFTAAKNYVAARTVLISCTPCMALMSVSTDGRQMRVALLHLFAASASLLSLDHTKKKKTQESTPSSYLFLVLASNGNEADYTSKIDNFMLPN